MSSAHLTVQDLARRILALETSGVSSSVTSSEGASRVIARLRVCLIKLVGVNGFRSLLSRALTLGKAEIPSLNMVQVSGDGLLVGLDEVERNHGAEAAVNAGLDLVTKLLELLVTFIGESLTLRLVHDTWLDETTEEGNVRIGEET
jgi:hypothetical protein